MASLIVILVYGATLSLILFPPRALLVQTPDNLPWWRNVRFWASVIVAVQVAIYAAFG